MATVKEMLVNGVLRKVVEFDRSAQEIDDAVDRVDFYAGENLVDNGYFLDAINQRGGTEYRRAGYTVDRWTASNAGLLVARNATDGGWQLTNNHSELVYFRQYFETPLPAGVYTLSVLASLATGGVKMYLGLGGTDFTDTVPVLTGLTAQTFTIPEGKGVHRVQFNIPAAGVFNPLAVKLERGAVQTLARRETDGSWSLIAAPPNKTLELMKCQRYFRIFRTESLRPTHKEDFSPPMRIDPPLGTLEIDGVTYYTADANL